MTTLHLKGIPRSFENRINTYYKTDRYVELNKGDEVVFPIIINFKEGADYKTTKLGVSAVVTKVTKWFYSETADYVCELLPDSITLAAARIQLLDSQDDSNIEL